MSGVDGAGMDEGLGVSERMRDGLACQGLWSAWGIRALNISVIKNAC